MHTFGSSMRVFNKYRAFSDTFTNFEWRMNKYAWIDQEWIRSCDAGYDTIRPWLSTILSNYIKYL